MFAHPLCHRLVPLILLACPAFVYAQGTQADYDRSKGFNQWTQNKVFRTAVVPHWPPTGGDPAGKEWGKAGGKKIGPPL